MEKNRLKFIDRQFERVICWNCARIVETHGANTAHKDRSSKLNCDACRADLKCTDWMYLVKDHLLLRTYPGSKFYIGSYKNQMFAFFSPLTIAQIKRIYYIDKVKKYEGIEYRMAFKNNRGLSPMHPKIKEKFSNKYFLRYLSNDKSYMQHRRKPIKLLVKLALDYMY